MALVLGLKNGKIEHVIGDTNAGFDLMSFALRKLAEQCYFQHVEQDRSFSGNSIEKFWRNEKNENFYVQYANGDVWVYNLVDYGAAGMMRRKVDVEIEFFSKEVNFQGVNGYMVTQLNNGKTVCEQFVSQKGYELFCKEINTIPKLVD